MLRNVPALILVTTIGMSLFLSGCRRPTEQEQREDLFRNMVAEVLKHAHYREAGTIQFSTTLFEPNTTIYFGLAGGKKTVLEKSGHLIYIDERPDYDWEHKVKLVSFEPTRLNEPKVLYYGDGPIFKIVDKDGNTIDQVWVSW